MSSFFGLAEQLITTATGSESSDPDSTVRKTGGQEFNSPHHTQQPHGSFDTQRVLDHAEADDEEGQGMIANALQHVHGNSHQARNEQVSESDMSTYGPMVLSALSSLSSKSGGMDIGSLVSGGLGQGGGNQLMGLVMKEASGALGGGGGQDKQSMMNGAAMTVAKLLAQQQLSSFVGGSNSGGLGMLSGIGGSMLKNLV